MSTARIPDGTPLARAIDLEDRLIRILNGSGEFWVEAKEIDGLSDVRLSVSDHKNDGPWFTVMIETGAEEN